MHAFSRSLARAVKNARDKMNLTQEQVGELVETNTRTISSIENQGKRYNPAFFHGNHSFQDGPIILPALFWSHHEVVKEL